MSLTKVSYSMITGSPVNVLDFGADPTGVADSTAAFTAAQIVSQNVIAPQGTYLLDNLRIQNGVHLVGDGYNLTFFKQGNAGRPAINCLSDASVGQLSSLRIAEFTVQGATGATVAAISVAAFGVYAIWKSVFDFVATNTFSALNIQGNDAANVFWCEFKVTSENTTDISVVANGGVYNKFSLFLAQCFKSAYVGSQSAAIYSHLVTEGPVAVNDQNSIFNSCSVENLPQFVGTTSYAITDGGFNNVWNTPVVILNTASAAKITTAVFATFSGTIVNAPRFIMLGTPVANPFAASTLNWTLIGPGQNSCTNTMETIYDNADNSKDLRSVSFVGDCSSFTSNPVPHGGKSIQYLAPAGNFNLGIQNNTDAMIINGSGTIAVANVGYGYAGQTSYINGQTLSIWTANAITAFNFSGASGVDTSLFPTTLTAGQKITFIYHSATNKFYPI